MSAPQDEPSRSARQLAQAIAQHLWDADELFDIVAWKAWRSGFAEASQAVESVASQHPEARDFINALFRAIDSIEYPGTDAALEAWTACPLHGSYTHPAGIGDCPTCNEEGQ
jgi:hypothetical protein